MDEIIVGVDLGGTNVRAGRVHGRSLDDLAARPISARESAEHVLGEVFETVDQVFDDGVAGIGFGVPGVIDVERGIVYDVENIPAWREMHLKERLEERYGVPAVINNDANAFTVGEVHFGKARGYRYVVGLTLGTGLGAGVVVDGRLYSGSNCGAGEVGQIPYREHRIEEYCSGAFFRRETGEDGSVVFERARRGDRRALALYERFGREVGQAVMTVLYAYDPEIVVLGGSVSKAFPLFEAGLKESLERFAYPHALARFTLEVSNVDNISVLGAAALYLDAARAAQG